MQIAHVKISNILGIAELEFTPQGFNEIAGPNGTGKTSVLEAIKSVVTGGHDATLLRKGAEKGEVVLVLDDGTTLRKRVTPKTSPLEVMKDGAKVGRPTDTIKALTDLLSVNPIDFLRAPKKDRVRVLLETMPLEVDAQKLTEISGVPVPPPSSAHALAVIEAARQQVYDDRTGTNRAVKEKEATINQLRLAMPDAPGGVDGSEDELRAQVAAADAALEAEKERVRTKLDGIKAENQAKIDAIRAEAQRQIDEIKAKALAEVEAIQAAERNIEGKAALQRELTIAKHTETVTPLNQALATIAANRSTHAKRAQALETVEKLEKELVELVEDAKRQTKALADIEQYKADLLAALPIPGVEVKDGEIYQDGVPFDRLNTAKQVNIAVEIAKLRAGELGLICVDGVELLDSQAFELFRERALQSGLQLFVTRVSDQEFAVKSTAVTE